MSGSLPGGPVQTVALTCIIVSALMGAFVTIMFALALCWDYRILRDAKRNSRSVGPVPA